MVAQPPIVGIADDLFPPDDQPRPCPRCGRIPRLVVREDGPNCYAHYQCRGWLGLRSCRRGTEATELRGCEGWARRAAAVKWNRSIPWGYPVLQLGRTGKVVAAVWLAGACAAVMAGSLLGSDAMTTPGILALLLWIHAYRRIP